MSIDQFYIDCVVAIGTKTPEGRKEWRGSGFFYAYPHISVKDNLTVFIVTNRHVIDGLDEIIIKFNPDKQGESNEITYAIPDSLRFICPNEKADIAVIHVTQLINENINIKYLKKNNGITVENITNSNIGEGDLIYVIGFPVGIVNDQQNAALVRNGSIAQIRNLINGNSNEFIIDASIFPGNSGGPVFLKPEPIASVGHSYAEPKLIGIVHSYYTYRDKAISPQTLQPRVLFEENSGLGAVYPVDTIEKSIKKYYEDITKIGRKIIHNVEIMDQITDLEVHITEEVEKLKNTIEKNLKNDVPSPVIKKIKNSIENEDMREKVIKDLKESVNLIKEWYTDKSIAPLISSDELNKIKRTISKIESLIKESGYTSK